LNPNQVRDVLVETIKEEDAVLQRILVRKEKETVMDLVMEVNMMDTEDVSQDWFVELIIAESLVSTFMKRMIAVRSHHPHQHSHFLRFHLVFGLNPHKEKNAVGGIMEAEDAVIQIILVTLVKETVMDLEMEDSTMETEAASKV